MNKEQKLIKLLKDLDSWYGFISDWHGNGCEHGFKPAKDCPNKDCKDAELNQRFHDLVNYE